MLALCEHTRHEKCDTNLITCSLSLVSFCARSICGIERRRRGKPFLGTGIFLPSEKWQVYVKKTLPPRMKRSRQEEEEEAEFINEKCACPPRHVIFRSRPAEKCFFYAKLDIREGSFPTAVHSQPALAFVGIRSPSEFIVKAKWTRRSRQHHPNGNVARVHVLWNLETGLRQQPKNCDEIKIFCLFFSGVVYGSNETAERYLRHLRSTVALNI